MKKLILSLFTAAVLCTAYQSAHAFGLPGIGGQAGSIDNFLKAADDAETLMRGSSWHLAMAVLAKSRLGKLTTRREAIEKITDPQEKGAKLREFDKDLTAELVKVNYAEMSKKLERQVDDKKKAQTASSVYNFMLGALRDAELVQQGQSLVTTPPSPAIAAKLPRVKNFLANMTGQMDSLGKVVSGLKKLSTPIGLKSLPTKTSDRPMPLAD